MKITVSLRLILTSIVAVAMCLLVGVVGLNGLASSNRSLSRITRVNSALQNQQFADMMHDALRGDVLEAIQSTEEERKKEISSETAEHAKWFRDRISENAAMNLGNEIAKAINEVKPRMDLYVRRSEEMVNLSLSKPEEGLAKMPEYMVLFGELEDSMAKLSDTIDAQSHVELDTQKQTASTTKLWMIASMVIATVSITLFQVLTRRSIVIPLRRCGEVLGMCAKGDLTKRVEWNRQDEFGALASATNTLAKNMGNIIVEVQQSANEVASAATEIASSATEMSAAIADVAQQTTQASTSASESGRIAKEGGEVVTRTIKGMQQIDQAVSASAASVAELGNRGRQIGEIVSVINDIADQTNLLALNAAIEAARAGEHGRGFAVVADEVRKLAERTSKATEEVGQSIQAIQKETEQAVTRMSAGTEHVKGGVELATQAGASLDLIVSGATDVAGMVRSIAAAAEEAGAGAGQSADAAGQLSAKAEQLQDLVRLFKVA